MSSDKLPSALSFSQPLPSQHHSSPRGLGNSILNGSSYPKKEHSQALPSPSTPQNGTPQYSTSANQFAYSNENTGYMNPQSNSSYGPLDYSHQHHLSQGQPPTPQTATSGGGLASFPPQPPLLQPTYSQPSHAFPGFSFPSSNVASPSGQPGVSGPMSVHPQQPMLPLPQSTALSNHSPLSAVSQGGPQTPQSATAGAYSNHSFDATGQIAPPGMKPRVAATLWEDEGSLCFQVEARGVCVARREDNHMINGTKLLNVAGMTRGRRDGILKSEKVRHVVKIGPMHLKGVWIPFERALDFANKEKITELLYPLFVHNIGAFLYHPTNTHRTNAVMAAAERRRADSTVLSQSQALNQGALQRRATTDLIPSSQPPPLHQMHNPMSLPPNLGQPRPELQRSISFPTPPSSASSVMGVGGSDNSFWGGGVVSQGGNGSLAIDTVMNSRSMPTTPATTPPGGIQQLQQYPPPSSMYSSNQTGMGQQSIAQQNMQRFNQPLPQPSQFMSQNRDTSNMGPPTSRVPAQTLSRPASRQDESHPKEEGGEDQNGLAGEEEYTTHDSNYSNGHRPGVYYPPLQTESHLSPEMNGSPGQGPSTPARSTYPSNASVPRTVDGGNGATPRTTTTPQQQWVQGGNGYSTPPRANSANGSAIRQPPQRNLYQLVGGDSAADQTDSTGTGAPDNTYATQSGLNGVPMPSQTPPQSYGVNGTTTPSSNKRVREIDDDEEQGSRPSSRDHDDRGPDDGAGLKRRKTIGREGAPPAPATGMATGNFDRSADGRLNRTRSAVGPGRVPGRR